MNAASLLAIATSVAEERDLKAVLHRIVAELAAQPHVALTRIWLIEHGSVDGLSPAQDQSGKPSGLLRLAASAGTPHAGKDVDWTGH